jgi:hypothetical protein
MMKAHHLAALVLGGASVAFAAAAGACGSDGAVDGTATRRALAERGANVAPEASPAPLRVELDASAPTACSAPSVTLLRTRDDSRDLADLASCSPDDDYLAFVAREQQATPQCATERPRPIDLQKILAAALALDGATIDHLRRVRAVGKVQHRRLGVFGMVGDSMTVDYAFMKPFGAGTGYKVVLSRDVERALSIDTDPASSRPPSGGTSGGRARDVLDLMRSGIDSFTASRAAKVGVRASWPNTPRGRNATTPLDEMIDELSPATAVVLYGANDALWRIADLPSISRELENNLAAIVDALEARGVVPILTTIPKHMHEVSFRDCAGADAASNERYMIQTNALSAAVADLACTRHLPLVDLRWALDDLVNHGVGPDGVHLTSHPSGGGILDASGLGCGYNVRNLVTLRMLKIVYDALRPLE